MEPDQAHRAPGSAEAGGTARKQGNTAPSSPSTPGWEELEAFVRGAVHEFVQGLLEEAGTALLGRARDERRAAVAPVRGDRPGPGKERTLSTTVGTIRLRRPRVRGLRERFASRMRPLVQRRPAQVGELRPKRYRHGLAHGACDRALRGLLGDGAPLSPGSIARRKEVGPSEDDAWRSRPLHERAVVDLWGDGLDVKAGLAQAAVLVAGAGRRDGRTVVVAVEAGHRESTASWSSMLRDLPKRGLGAPRRW